MIMVLGQVYSITSDLKCNNDLQVNALIFYCTVLTPHELGSTL